MNKKKSILFVNNNLDTGGVQRSLVNLLNLISDKYDVTLFVFSNTGEYKDCLNPGVKVIEASPILSLLGISQEQAKTKGFSLYCARAIMVIYTKIINNHLPIRFLVSVQKKMTGYDIAISFLHNCTGNILYGGCNDFVLHRVEAKQKISFIHCDFLEYGGNTAQNRKMYEHFDKIAAVSEGCKKSFLQAVPKLDDRTYCVYNCNNYLDYKAMADENPIKYPNEYLNIVTVARLGSEKGIMRGIESICKLYKEGYKIRWHIVGNGPQKSEIDHKIRSLGLGDNIILYGNQQNPYRYIKNADALLISSFHEAAPMVIDEAKSLGIPVISTNTTSAEEMILKNREGFICENSEEGIYKVLRYLIDYPNMLFECREYLSKQTYNNEKALSQFNNLIDKIEFNETVS